MIYDFYKVKKQKNYLTSFDHARKNVQAYATALKEFNECRDNFLAELVPVKAGESVPLGKGWNAYIISVDAAADTGKYSLKYFPYSGRHKPVISASTPNPVCFQTVDSDPAREEFKAMTGLSLDGGGKRDEHCLKILNMARARLLRLEDIANTCLSKTSQRLCPFEKGQAIYNANPKNAFGEKNIGRVNSVLPLKLDPLTCDVFFPDGEWSRADFPVKIKDISSLFCLEVVFRKGGISLSQRLWQSSCSGLEKKRGQ